MALKHKKVLTIPDGVATARVRPTDWNNTHDFEGGINEGDSLFWKSTVDGKHVFGPLLLPGTRVLFDQDTAPLGWTRDTEAALNDRVVRLVTGARQPNGGSWTVSGLTFTGTPMAAHSHQVSHTHSMAGHAHETPGVFHGGTNAFFHVAHFDWPYGSGAARNFRVLQAASMGGVESHGALLSGPPSNPDTGTSSIANTAVATAGTPTGSVTQSGNWRPLHRDTIVAVKDAL